MQKVAVLGAGSFGTVLANLAAQNSYNVTVWFRSPSKAKAVQDKGENTDYLPGYPLDQKHLKVTSDLAVALQDACVVIIAVPSEAFNDLLILVREQVKGNLPMFVSATKGIDPKRLLTMSDLLREHFPSASVGVLSGPNIATEIAAGIHTSTVIASTSSSLRDFIVKLLSNERFSVRMEDDVRGVEVAGAMKNIYAILCGIGSALGIGYNTIAMLVVDALAEMAAFVKASGANPVTLLNLSGVGDLLLTCTSPLSRNFQFGERLGNGMTLREAAEDLGKLVEGVQAAKLMWRRKQTLEIETPILDAMYEIVSEQANANSIFAHIMRSLMQSHAVVKA